MWKLFLTTVKAKGSHYIYLSCYEIRKYYTTNKKIIFGFGRNDKAIKKMHQWKNNFNEFPRELISIGCNESDLSEWIMTLETGITKTGREFKGAINRKKKTVCY